MAKKEKKIARSRAKEEDARIFAERLESWGAVHGRKGLPWSSDNPYVVWVSELMLQQTTVSQARDYFLRWMERFPTVEVLAAASEQEVLAAWAGLGYYGRARALLAGARLVVEKGGFPKSATELKELLPGVGRSTAGAIASFCYGENSPILDGNVRRVLSRCFGDFEGTPAEAEREAWATAESCMSNALDKALYSQSVMDLGAIVCLPTGARCSACPMSGLCSSEGRPKAPQRKARAKKREEFRSWLLIERNGDILSRRLASEGRGVWKGLLVFPEAHEIPEARTGEIVYSGKAELSHVSIRHETRRAEVPTSFVAPRGFDFIPAELFAESGVPKPVASTLEKFFEFKKKEVVAIAAGRC